MFKTSNRGGQTHASTGMPIIKLEPMSRDEALAGVVKSIALEQKALSHVIDAEGEKLQRIISLPNVTPTMMMEVNQSVSGLVGGAAGIEDALQNKLKYALSIMPEGATFTLKMQVFNTHLPVGGTGWTLSSASGTRLSIVSKPGPGYEEITFTKVPEGTYELTETTVPEGFEPAGVFTVYVDARNNATIRPGASDDPDPEKPVPANGFVVYHERDIESLATSAACAGLI